MDAIWSVSLLPSGVQYAIGVPVILIGLALFMSAVREFGRAQTAVTHHHPTTKIVTSGPFAFSRNPIYLSMTTVYLGTAIAADSLLIMVHVVPAVAAINTLVIPKEEQFLETTFADDYQRYKSTVRRWI